MIKANKFYGRLQGSYLFSEIAKRVSNYQEENPEAKIIKLGIGDVTLPLSNKVIENLHEGVNNMAVADTFKGYGPEQGYAFLREAINKMDFASRGVKLDDDEIFVSTGAKEDSANIQEIFSQDIKVAVPDPVYPVYVDSNVMAGRSGEFVDGRYDNFVYLEGTADNNFKPALPTEDVDLIYLCFPNNPTGQVLTKDELKVWVDYALEKNALIIFDAAYEAFITEDNVPHSIYEIEGAKKCAIEMRSMSKTAGFTGTRCAYTVVPKELIIKDEDGNEYSVNQLWNRRQCTKFNGVAYLIQQGALAAFTPEGRAEINKLIEYYLGNAKIIREGIEKLGLTYSGGVNSPYIWFKTPGGLSSWDFFNKFLGECQVVGTPGAGFGKCGEGYFRLSAFGSRENVEEAISRLSALKF
jgi:LL-diaminopimelate aminotransferase